MSKAFFLCVLLSLSLQAIDFEEALLHLQKHESIESIISMHKTHAEEARLRGSWGDPHLKIAAKNFPADTFSSTQTPMTGVEVAISQKIPLTSKYQNSKHAFKALSEAYRLEAQDKQQRLTKAFWEILIVKRKISEELSILNENSVWIGKILKVSKRLYATGKTSQQAILEIQIRKAEIERDISNKLYEVSQINDRLFYLIGDTEVDPQSIPWNILENSSQQGKDYKELSLQERIRATEHKLKASELNYIPDLMLSFGYTQRSNIDGHGDFVSASISFPLPISDEKDAKYGMAIHEKAQVQQQYENYQKVKMRDMELLYKEIEKLFSEIRILDEKIIKFAKNAREITSKAYSIGNATYIELLQSELKLQNILMHKVMLEAKRDMKYVDLKYIRGEPLI